MLACIACSKHVDGSMEEEEEEQQQQQQQQASSPATRESIKCLTNQLKGLAVRFSAGAYRRWRPCTVGDGAMVSYDGIDSMDIMDASSELSFGSSTHNNSIGGSNTSSYYSTPAQSFKGTPSNRSRCETPTNNITSRHRNATKNREEQGTKHVNNNRDKISNYDNVKKGNTIKQEPGPDKNGFKVDVEEEHDETEKEWVAQVEPGVLITFVTLVDGGNDLKRIRFSREVYNKWQAQQWWAENCDKIHELYNVPKFSRMPRSLPAPSHTEDEGCQSQNGGGEEYKKLNAHEESKIKEGRGSDEGTRGKRKVGWHARGVSMVSDEPSTTGIASPLEGATEEDNEDAELSRCCSGGSSSEYEEEWIEEDEPGVYITLTSHNGSSTQLKRIRFRREKFTELQARLWWEHNRIRVYEQYL